MSTPAPSTAPPPIPEAPSGQREITLIGHSSLFYWWPVWACGFFMAAWTAAENNRLALRSRRSQSRSSLPIARQANGFRSSTLAPNTTSRVQRT